MNIKNLFFSTLLASSLLAGTIAPAAADEYNRSHCPNQGYSQAYGQNVSPYQNSFAQEVLRLTNQARAQYGLAPLQAHHALESAAAGHTQEMLDLGYFSHNSPTPGKSQPDQRVRSAGASPRMVSENIFQCEGYDAQEVAQLAIDNWLESPGHRQNLLDPRATHLGIGFVEKNGTIAVTQVFGGGL